VEMVVLAILYQATCFCQQYLLMNLCKGTFLFEPRFFEL
jgi:hypothetical protein